MTSSPHLNTFDMSDVCVCVCVEVGVGREMVTINRFSSSNLKHRTNSIFKSWCLLKQSFYYYLTCYLLVMEWLRAQVNVILLKIIPVGAIGALGKKSHTCTITYGLTNSQSSDFSCSCGSNYRHFRCLMVTLIYCEEVYAEHLEGHDFTLIILIQVTVITSIIMVYGKNIDFTVSCQGLFPASTWGIFFSWTKWG